MKRKLILLIGAILLSLAISVGTYAYTFSTTTTTIDAAAATGEIVTHEPAPSIDQPYWYDVLPYSPNDQEILRPDGPGDSTGIGNEYPDGSEHWDVVDDVTPDDWDSYVYTMTKLDRTDLYSISNHVEGTWTITGVTVYYRIAANAASYPAYARAAIKTGGDTFEGTLTTHTGDVFGGYAYTWANNPDTGLTWTWDEIDALQAGITMAKYPNASFAACTQVYVLVDYELPPIVEGEVPSGDLFLITPHPTYTGDLLVNIYMTNTGFLKMAYQHLNIKVYMANSLEAGKTPDYQVLSLENGLASFNIEGGASADYTVEVTGGGYRLVSGDPDDWGEEWTVVPELYCEVTQR